MKPAWLATFAPCRFAPRWANGSLVALLAVAGCRHLAPPAPLRSIDALDETSQVSLLFAVDEAPPETSATWERTPDDSTAALTLSIDDAVALALQGNPRLRMARAAVERARGEEHKAFAPFLPDVGLTNRIGAVSNNLSPGAPGISGGIVGGLVDAPHTFMQSELQIQWMLHDFGRTSGRYQRAVSQERIAELQYSRLQETVGFDAGAGLLQGLLATALRIVQEDAIRAAESTLKDSRVRRAAGVADRDDVLRAEVQVSEVREAWVLARETELAAFARLNNVLGRNAALPLTLVEPRLRPPLPPSLKDCLEIAAVRRPEIGVVQNAVAAARSGREAAAAEYRPRIYVRGSVGYVDGNNILKGFQEGVGLHLDQPIYQGGRRAGELHAAEAEILAASANAQAMLDVITLEVTIAFRGVGAAHSRIELSKPAVAEAEENLRLVRTRYRNGNATPTDIVDAESTLTRAKQRYAVATYDYLIALIRLDYALGNPPAAALTNATR